MNTETMNTVWLYEDNAGGLYLGLDNGPWWQVDGKPGKFLSDAWGLATTDGVDMANVPADGKLDGEPQAKLVAKLDNSEITVLYNTLANSAAPGSAAQDYMRGWEIEVLCGTTYGDRTAALFSLGAQVLEESEYGDPDSSLMDWLAAGSYKPSDTVESIAAEWDSNRE